MVVNSTIYLPPTLRSNHNPELNTSILSRAQKSSLNQASKGSLGVSKLSAVNESILGEDITRLKKLANLSHLSPDHPIKNHNLPLKRPPSPPSDYLIFSRLRTEGSASFLIGDLQKEYSQWMGRLRMYSNNPVFDSIFGTLICRMKCTLCGRESFKLHLFSGLEVDLSYRKLKKGHQQFSYLEELLGYNFTESYLEGQDCHFCRMKTVHQSKQKIFDFPKTLIVSFKGETKEAIRNENFVKLKRSNLTLDEHAFERRLGAGYNLRAYMTREAGINTIQKERNTVLESSKSQIFKNPNSTVVPDSYLEDSFSLTYYCSYLRKWFTQDSKGLREESQIGEAAGSDKLSYCVYEFMGQNRHP